MTVPFELRNDFASIALDGEPQAAAVRVLDESSKRRRVGLLSQAEADQAQPLLSPLYYIRRALRAVRRPGRAVERRSCRGHPAAPRAEAGDDRHGRCRHHSASRRGPQLIDWVKNGGTLVRFAGSRLAAAGNDEDLLPVRLRTRRTLAGRRAVLDDAAAGHRISAERPLRRPRAARRGDGDPAGAGRADARHRRAHLGEPRRRHAAGHRRAARARARWCCSTSRRKRHGRTCRFPAASSRCCGASCSCRATRARPPPMPKASRASLAPYRMIAADGTLVPPTPDARPLCPAAGRRCR